jgi:hypothetical protein
MIKGDLTHVYIALTFKIGKNVKALIMQSCFNMKINQIERKFEILILCLNGQMNMQREMKKLD